MAQTKRKRRTKHRGNAAGVIEARGRTGRKPTAGEKRVSARDEARARRVERMDRPPTWKGALNRAFVATAILFVVSVFILDYGATRALALMPVVLAIYVPLGYMTDVAVYRARQRRKARQAATKDG
jgi:hypothetical protein